MRIFQEIRVYKEPTDVRNDHSRAKVFEENFHSNFKLIWAFLFLSVCAYQVKIYKFYIVCVPLVCQILNRTVVPSG